MNSIRARLAFGLILSISLLIYIQWVFFSASFHDLSEEIISSRLEHDAENILSAIEPNKNNQFTVNYSKLGKIYRRPYSGHYFVVAIDGVIFTSRSLWDFKLDHRELDLGIIKFEHALGPQGQKLLLRHASYRKGEKVIFVAVAENVDTVEATIHTVEWQLTAASLAFLFLIIFVQGFILRFGFKPLVSTETSLKQLELGKISRLNTNVPKEILGLVNEVNHLATVTEQRLNRSRNALGDLAHALKGPLTILSNLEDSDDLEKGKSEVMQIQLNEMQRILQRVLKRARLAGDGPPAALFSVKDDLVQMIEILEMMYPDKNISVQTVLPRVDTLPFDREDMMELIGNLLDNAFKWASANILITIDVTAQTLISIEDDGPGVSAEQLALLTYRGKRMDEHKEGFGLGLSICLDCVNEYQGSIIFEKSKVLGGLLVFVRLPVP